MNGLKLNYVASSLMRNIGINNFPVKLFWSLSLFLLPRGRRMLLQRRPGGSGIILVHLGRALVSPLKMGVKKLCSEGAGCPLLKNT